MRAIAVATVTLSSTALLAFVVEADTRPSGPWVVPLLMAVSGLGGGYLLALAPLTREWARRVGVAVRSEAEPDIELRPAVSTALSDDRLRELCETLGGEIEQFAWATNKAKPVLEVGVTPEDQWALVRSRQLNHDLMALRQYERRFSGQVFRLIRELEARSYLTREDAEALDRPESMADVWRTGERLQQLALRLQTPALTA